MEKDSQKLLQELISERGISKELLASKFQVTTMTISRWVKGENLPSYGDRRLLKQIYNGYRNKKKK